MAEQSVGAWAGEETCKRQGRTPGMIRLEGLGVQFRSYPRPNPSRNGWRGRSPPGKCAHGVNWRCLSEVPRQSRRGPRVFCALHLGNVRRITRALYFQSRPARPGGQKKKDRNGLDPRKFRGTCLRIPMTRSLSYHVHRELA